MTATPDQLTDKNIFAYCDNNPVTRLDEDGEFWITLGIMAVGGVIGGAISAYCSVVAQQAFTGEVNWASVAVAAASGFVSGCVAASPLGLPGQIIAGGVIGGLSYGADAYVNDSEVTLDGAVISIGMGMLSGLIGGKGANHNFALTDAIKSTKNTLAREARRANQQYAQKVITTSINNRNNTLKFAACVSSLRYAGGAFVSSNITSWYSNNRIFNKLPSYQPR